MSTKRVTSQDVARLAGVSRTTVSLVLNNVPSAQISEETRQRVQDAARELGYVPDAAAQALASRRAQTVGLILTLSPAQIASDTFLTQVLHSLMQVVHSNDMRLLMDVVEPEHQRERYLQLVRAKHIDGVLISGPRLDDSALQLLDEEDFPTVLLGQLPGTNLCQVDVDNVAAARQAVEHLIRLGHQRIACLTNAPSEYTAAIDRRGGYQEALAAAGITYDPALIAYGDFSLNSGYQQMQRLLAVTPRPTAVFVASDVVAFGAITAINELQLRIPQDVALVGFDDVPFARYIDPPLTTIHLPAADLARTACEMLFDLIRGETPEVRQVLLPTELIVRSSCGAMKR